MGQNSLQSTVDTCCTLANNINALSFRFTDATAARLGSNSYLVCCSGSKEYCWPTHKKIIQDTGIKKSSLQKAIKVLVKRKLIAMYKHRNPYGYSNNEYHLLSLDNPEIYRDLDTEADELPLFIGEELPA